MSADDSAVLFDRATAALQKGQFPQALLLFDRLLARHPTVPEVLASHAAALVHLGRFAEALAGFDQAMARQPGNVQTIFGKGTALTGLKRWEEAVAAYNRALTLQPDLVWALANRSQALIHLNRFAEAEDDLVRALALSDLADLGFNMAMLKLQTGRLAEGWPLYEMRKVRSHVRVVLPSVDAPEWQGEDLAGKTLLLHAEQGLGDTLQFCRYAKVAEARGAKVILSVPARLMALLAQSGLTVVDEKVPLPLCDYHALLMSMPLRFATDLQTVPAATPYLKATPDKVRRWADWLGPQGLKIGIAWQGDPLSMSDPGRSMPLCAFAPLAQMPGARLISLQTGPGREQLDHLPAGMRIEQPGPDFDSGPHGFVDTAALMESLDLIVTADTAAAHLAGALRRPVWVALQYVPEWRWLLSRDDSPWYPGMRLFRQPQRDDWNSVFTAMAKALEAL